MIRKKFPQLEWRSRGGSKFVWAGQIHWHQFIYLGIGIDDLLWNFKIALPLGRKTWISHPATQLQIISQMRQLTIGGRFLFAGCLTTRSTDIKSFGPTLRTSVTNWSYDSLTSNRLAGVWIHPRHWSFPTHWASCNIVRRGSSDRLAPTTDMIASQNSSPLISVKATKTGFKSSRGQSSS